MTSAPILDLVLEQLAGNTQYSDYGLVAVDDGSTDGIRAIPRAGSPLSNFLTCP